MPTASSCDVLCAEPWRAALSVPMSLIVFDSPASSGSTYQLSALLASPGAADDFVVSAPRTDSRADVALVPHAAVTTSADVGQVGGFIDGVQSMRVLSWCDHTPVVLAYVAAGAADFAQRSRLVGLSERLMVVAAEHAGDQVSSAVAASGVPVELLDCPDIPSFPAAVSSFVSNERSVRESSLTRALADARPDTLWVVDGALPSAAPESVVSVVKSCATRYLSDESVLYRLAPGQCSPVFTFSPTHFPADVKVVSCYVRLHSALDGPWNRGLVRVEALSVERLGAAASVAWRHRQSRASGDRRWDVHMAPIAECERLLRDRRPIVFSLT